MHQVFHVTLSQKELTDFLSHRDIMGVGYKINYNINFLGGELTKMGQLFKNQS